MILKIDRAIVAREQFAALFVKPAEVPPADEPAERKPRVWRLPRPQKPEAPKPKPKPRRRFKNTRFEDNPGRVCNHEDKPCCGCY